MKGLTWGTGRPEDLNAQWQAWTRFVAAQEAAQREYREAVDASQATWHKAVEAASTTYHLERENWEAGR